MYVRLQPQPYDRCMQRATYVLDKHTCSSCFQVDQCIQEGEGDFLAVSRLRTGTGSCMYAINV